MTALEIAMGKRDAALLKGNLEAIKQAQDQVDIEAAQLRLELAKLKLDEAGIKLLEVGKAFGEALGAIMAVMALHRAPPP
jgi:hypothetical protein